MHGAVAPDATDGDIVNIQLGGMPAQKPGGERFTISGVRKPDGGYAKGFFNQQGEPVDPFAATESVDSSPVKAKVKARATAKEKAEGDEAPLLEKRPKIQTKSTTCCMNRY